MWWVLDGFDRPVLVEELDVEEVDHGGRRTVLEAGRLQHRPPRLLSLETSAHTSLV